MHPKLFEIPFIHVTVWTYGVMMVVGFLSAVLLIRHLSRDITPDPQLITNAALYSLIAGVVGARLFYIVHHFHEFKGRPLSVFAIWQGGLELFGGVLLAITIICIYLWYHKLPIRRYLDILAIGLVLALAFGRTGCFFRGCCFGRPTDLPWAIRFPYASPAYHSQVYPDWKRDRPFPHLHLPQEFFEVYNGTSYLKSYESLTEEQKWDVTRGPYRCLPIHPTQLYSSANGLLSCLLLYLFWRRSINAAKSHKRRKFLTKPGSTFSLMFILYGIARFFIEFLRDDNPFEHAWWIIYKGGTISQSLGIYLAVFGIILLVIFQKIRPGKITLNSPK